MLIIFIICIIIYWIFLFQEEKESKKYKQKYNEEVLKRELIYKEKQKQGRIRIYPN